MHSSPHRTRRGIALIFTIGIVAALVALIAVAAGAESIVQNARSNALNLSQARLQAENGIQYGLQALSGQSQTATLQTDTWAITGNNGNYTQPGSETFQVGDGSFRMQIVDACSLINLNTAGSTQLLNLGLTQEQVDCILDWREPSTTQRTDGAKDVYYTALTNPYNAKLGPFDTVSELLLVKDFTAATLYDVPSQQQTSSNLTPTASGQLPTLYSLLTVDSAAAASAPAGAAPTTGGAGGGTGGAGGAAGGAINVSTGNIPEARLTAIGFPPNIAQEISRATPVTGYGALLRLPGVNNAIATLMLTRLTVATTSTAGKINLNTASNAVLNTLPGITPDVATAIVTQQTSGFPNLASVLNISGVTPASAANFIDSVCVASATFLIRSIGTYNGTQVALQATVKFVNNQPQIEKISEEPFSDIATRWQWYDSTNSDVLVDPSQLQTNS